MDFVNRTEDFDRVISSVDNFDVTYILAGKAFGLTSFMNELSHRLNLYRVFTLNTINGSNIANLLVSDIIHSNDRDDFKRIAEHELGEKSTSYISAILQCIPYAGPGLAYMTERKAVPPIYAGNYSSAIEEVILPFIKKYVIHNKIFISIDEAQNMNEDSYNLIANLAQIDGVKIALGITNTIDANYIKLKNSLALYSSIKWNIVLFGQPEEKLVGELASYFGLTISDKEINDVLYRFQRNIHLIIDYMLSISTFRNMTLPFNHMDKSVVSFLYICYFGLPKRVLNSMIRLSNVYSPDIDNDLTCALHRLEERGCISKKSTENTVIYYLVSQYHPEVNTCINNYSDILYYKNIVFDYYQRPGMNNEQEILELLYKLALEFSSHSVKDYAVKVLEYKLKSGEKISEDIIANAHLSRKKNEEIELSVLYYTRERHYNEALNWLESLKGKRYNSHYHILKGVLLNRVRKFKEAEEILLYTINTASDPRVLNTLLAYYTANCIHTNQKHKALEEYNRKKIQLSETENWGYFLRNLSSAISFPYKEKFLKEAIDNFLLYKDEYGVYSCKCNWGNSLCVVKKAAEALSLLKEAEQGLQQFGPNHLHIIYNDLGVCYLMLGDVSNATKYISLAEKLALNRMPRIITQINKACLLAINNNYTMSLMILDSIYSDVLTHPISNIKRKYFNNRLLIEFMKSHEAFDTFHTRNRQYINEFVDQTTIQFYHHLAVESKQIIYKTEEWTTLFDPAGLAYWYVDPLKMI